MPANDALDRVVQQLEGIVDEASHRGDIPSTDLRRILAFTAKVAQVVDQAFTDVLAVLIDLKLLTQSDYDAGRIQELRRQLQLLLTRSRYRDAEEICSRLHHLRTQFEEQIRPLLDRVGDANRWRDVFWLIEEREGRIITLVEQTVRMLDDLLGAATRERLPDINAAASRQSDAVRAAVTELRGLTNGILGLSGTAGFLELTADRSELARQTSVFLNRGQISVSRDTYNVQQAAAVGPQSRAAHVSLHLSTTPIDLASLASELGQLRQVMRAQAKAAEHDISIGEVAAAEQAAKTGNQQSALEHLKKAGVWAFDVATKIGVNLASAALKSALGT